MKDAEIKEQEIATGIRNFCPIATETGFLEVDVLFDNYWGQNQNKKVRAMINYIVQSTALKIAIPFLVKGRTRNHVDVVYSMI